MFSKETQNTINTLISLKTDDNYDDNNKIASIMSKPDNQRTKEDNQTLTVHVIKNLVDKYTNQQQNKIASVTSKTNNKQVGEVAEFDKVYLQKSKLNGKLAELLTQKYFINKRI